MKKIEISSYKRLCFTLSTLIIASMISAACASGAISTSPTTGVDTKVMTQVSTQALVSTPEPLATESSIPTVAQPTATASTPGILAIVPVADGPIILAATAHSIWVEAHRANIVTRINPSQNKEVARLKDAPVHCNVVSGGGF